MEDFVLEKVLKNDDRQKIEVIYNPKTNQRFIKRSVNDDIRYIYKMLQKINNNHIPKIYDVELTDKTVVLEELSLIHILITEEKSNDTIFDNSVTKTLPDSIQEETKITDKPQVKNDTVPESEEPTVRPIHEDKYKSDNQCEIVVPSETVKPIKTTEPKQDEPKEEIKPQTSYGGHTTSGSKMCIRDRSNRY